MRNFFQLLLVVFCLLTATNPVLAQWVSVGPGGGNVKALAVSGTSIFAGTNGSGIFRSTNNGSSWMAVNNGLTNTSITALGANGSTVFAGTWGGAIFKSEDDGANWIKIKDGVSGSFITSFTFNGSKIFTSSSSTSGNGGNVFYLTNNGNGWTPAYTGLTSNVLSLSVSGANLFAATGSGVFKSTNDGVSWSEANNGFPSNTTAGCFAINNADIFVGTDAGVYKSNNQGDSWVRVSNGLSYEIGVYDIKISGTNIFAITDAGVFITSNFGNSWTIVNNGLPGTSVNILAITDFNIIAGTSAGLYSTTNNGTNWSEVNLGISEVVVNDLYVLGSNLYAGTNIGVFVTSNNGLNWNKINTGLTNLFVRKIACNETYLFAGTEDGLFRSNNNGASWTKINTGFSHPSYNSTLALAVNGSTIFTATSWGDVIKSVDNGVTWTIADTGLPLSINVKSLAIIGTKVFIGSESNGAFISNDNGNNWLPISSGIPNNINISAFAVDGSDVFALSNEGIFRSSDTGTNWTAITNSFYAQMKTLVATNNNLFAGNGYYGVFNSTFNGSGWKKINTGLNNIDVTSLVVSGNEIMAGTNGGGVYKRSMIEFYRPTITITCPANNSSFPIGSIIEISANATDTNTKSVVKVNFYDGKTLLFSDDTAPFTYSWNTEYVTSSTHTIKAVATNNINNVDSNSVTVTIIGANDLVLTQNFEGATFLPTGWTRNNPDNAITWVRKVASGNGTSTKSAFVNFWGYSAIGQLDDLTSPVFSLSSMDTANLSFNVAYRQYQSKADGLKVFISTNGGTSFNTTPVYNKSGASLATTNSGTGEFAPATISDWRLETVNLKPYVGNSNVVLRFQSVNDFGNNLYLDDIVVKARTVSSISENIPGTVTLSQNYPNPFNPSTTIVFTLPNSGYAELAIYNIKGELVKTMVKGVCQAGTQQLTFDGSAFASGMYYYRLTTPSQSIAKKMILLK